MPRFKSSIKRSLKLTWALRFRSYLIWGILEFAIKSKTSLNDILPSPLKSPGQETSGGDAALGESFTDGEARAGASGAGVAEFTGDCGSDSEEFVSGISSRGSSEYERFS